MLFELQFINRGVHTLSNNNCGNTDEEFLKYLFEGLEQTTAAGLKCSVLDSEPYDAQQATNKHVTVVQ